MKQYTTISQYIVSFPKSTQQLLKQMRATIKQVVPQAEEKISYGIPAFTLHGGLVHFAGYAHHIGFYPGAAAIQLFAKELVGYKTSKGTVQFPLDQPLPLTLIKKIVKFRVQQNLLRK